MEGENTDPLELHTPAITILIVIFGITIALITIIGNFLVIISLLIQSSLRTPPNVYLGSLALIDLAVGIFILPCRIFQVFNQERWDFGSTLCGIYLTLDVTLCTLSIYHLIAIALDRYRAICNGLRYIEQRNFRTVSINILFLWIVSFWISTPPALGWHNHDWGLQLQVKQNNYGFIAKPLYKKICRLTNNRGYVFHSAFGAFILPMMIVVILYYQLYKQIQSRLRKKARMFGDQMGSSVDIDLLSTSYKSRDRVDTGESVSSADILEDKENQKSIQSPKLKRIRFQDDDPEASNSGETGRKGSIKFEEIVTPVSANGKSDTLESIKSRESSSPWPHTENADKPTKKLRFSLTEEQQAARTLGAIIGAFLFCWLPFCCLYLVDAFLYTGLNETVWFEIVSWLGYTNSAMNPFIYSMYNKQFRLAFVRILCFFKNRRSVEVKI